MTFAGNLYAQKYKRIRTQRSNAWLRALRFTPLGFVFWIKELAAGHPLPQGTEH